MDLLTATSWEDLIQRCRKVIGTNPSIEARNRMLLDILDRELYDFRARHNVSRHIPVPHTQALFRLLFDSVPCTGNVLDCEPLRMLKDQVRERGFYAIGFTFDRGEWFLVPNA
jgi:hypothetical protein